MPLIWFTLLARTINFWGIAKKNLDLIAELSSGFYSLYVLDQYFAAATNPEYARGQTPSIYF